MFQSYEQVQNANPSRAKYIQKVLKRFSLSTKSQRDKNWSHQLMTCEQTTS